MSSHSRFGLVLSLLAVGLLLGCGDGRPDRVTVSGKVLIDGEPLSTGFVRLIPPNARPAVSEIQSDGSFSLTTFAEADGAVLGEHRILVNAAESKQNGMIMRYMVPQKYGDMQKSDLAVTVDEPTETMTIELTWEGSGHEGPYEINVGGSGDIDPSAVVE